MEASSSRSQHSLTSLTGEGKMSHSSGNIPPELVPLVKKLLPSLRYHGIIRKGCNEKDVRSSDIENLCKKVGVRMTLPLSDEPMPLIRLVSSLSSFAEFDQSYAKKLSFLDRSDKSELEIPKMIKSKSLKNFFGLPSIEKPSADALVYQCRKQVVVPIVQVQEEKKKRAEMRSGSHSLSMGENQSVSFSSSKFSFSSNKLDHPASLDTSDDLTYLCILSLIARWYTEIVTYPHKVILFHLLLFQTNSRQRKQNKN